MQKAITILESRQKTDKTDDQFDNYGKYIACQLREMPERAREYVEIKIQETIYQVKTYVNNGQQPPQPFQPANFHLPATPPAMFKAKFTHAKTGTTTLTQFPGNLKFINNNKLQISYLFDIKMLIRIPLNMFLLISCKLIGKLLVQILQQLICEHGSTWISPDMNYHQQETLQLLLI